MPVIGSCIPLLDVFRRGVGFPDHLDRCRDAGFDSDFHDPFLLASSFSHREADAAVTITYFAQKSGANAHDPPNRSNRYQNRGPEPSASAAVSLGGASRWQATE